MIGIAVTVALPLPLVAEGEMARISGGTLTPFFQDLDREEKRIQTVEVGDFYLDITPVTQRDFAAFVRGNEKWQRGKIMRLFADEGYLRNWPDGVTPKLEEEESPVTNVSWFAAKAYCEKRGKRLPTIHEWEYAARADEKNHNASRDPTFQKRILNWYGKPTPATLPKVGSTYKNAFGVYDMHGLVWEWTLDFNSVLLTGESRTDKGLERELFCAGGSVGVADVGDYASFMRYAFRASLQADYAVGNLGFRCAKDQEGDHEKK